MSPLEKYQSRLDSGEFKKDDQQRLVIDACDAIYQKLHLLKKTLLRKFRSQQPIKGLYLWGSVGIGKTALLDLFYDSLPCTKLRLHFFNFMRDTHAALQKKQGQKNPLSLIAKEIAQAYKVICFDEFFVSDITDAMILGELFQCLFKEGIVLIATSNIAPDDLYKNGLQRERFLSAIHAIKEHTTVIHLTTAHDYRLRHTIPTDAFLFPINDENQKKMADFFAYYTHETHSNNESIILNSHRLQVIKKNRGVLWCHFKDLCQEDRAPQDYLQLAREYHTLLLDDLKPIHPEDRKTILRFIHFIDILYDQHVRLIILSETPLNGIYTTGPHHVEFQRTVSRLTEMQSPYYLDRDDNLITS